MTSDSKYTIDKTTGLMRVKRKPGPKKQGKLSKSKCKKVNQVYKASSKRCHKRKSLSKKSKSKRARKSKSKQGKLSKSKCKKANQVYKSSSKRCHKRKSLSKARKCKSKPRKCTKSKSKPRKSTKSRSKKSQNLSLCIGRDVSQCGSNPNCLWTMSGCKSRQGVKDGLRTFLGPQLG